MKRFESWPVLPHEIAFGIFLAAMLARLIPKLGFFSPVTLLHLGLLVAAAVLIFWCRKNPNDLRWRISS